MGNDYSFCCNDNTNQNKNFEINNVKISNLREINFFSRVKITNKNPTLSSKIDYENNKNLDDKFLENFDDDNPPTAKSISRDSIKNKQDIYIFFLKENGIILNISDFSVEENIFNLDKNINNFCSEIITKIKSSQNIKKDNFIKNLINDHVKKNNFFFQNNLKNTENKNDDKTFISKQESDTEDKNSVEYQEIIKLKLFPVYLDINRKDKIYYGDWILNKKKFEDIKKNKIDETYTIKNLLDIIDLDGYGILLKKNSISEGFFRNNYLNGPGRIITYTGDIYKGNFEKGTLNEFGIFINKEGNKYEGNFKNNLRNGKVKEYFIDSSIFEGNYSNNKKNGEGKFIWADGSRFEGNILNNEMHGKGIFTWPNGIIYKGDWVKGKMDGNGIFIFDNGEYYEGDFKENKKNGKGKYFWNKNKYYKGNWLNNLQNGEGFYKDEDKELKGIWENGKIIKVLEQIKQNINKK